ncbi:hypothetical protein [Limnohabitans sp.]|uniref:hypothetical protein n=1 Tax=Limnohabitans sp. TaxID=1907725 RepID=UPI00286F03FA|nr:hypothetical protein [Limnohabitans sp.]
MRNAPFKRFCESHATRLQITPLQRLQGWGLLTIMLWLPGLGGALKQSMLTHMGVQVSLLVVAGYGLGRALLAHRPEHVATARRYRWSLMLIAVFTLMVWMLPRLLDLAVDRPEVDLLKVLSLVLCAGLPLAWAWPQLPVVAQGVLHLEALATLWRMGWLYLDSPSRLCLSYGLADQHSLGQGLMAAGLVYALWLAFTVLRGQAVPLQTPHVNTPLPRMH